MSNQVLIAALLFVAAMSFAAFFWHMTVFRNVPNKKPRKPERNQNRKADTRKLSRHEKKIFNQSQSLLKSGRITQAAQLLESIQMHRDAITALEEAGMIHAAAKMLLRMGRPNRAGVVYARHNYWERAAECFQKANLPDEVARCAYEAGNIEMAAENYSKAGKPAEAAQMFLELGNTHSAAKNFAYANMTNKAITQYKKIGAMGPKNKSFEPEEIKFLINWVREGHIDDSIFAIIATEKDITPILLDLSEKGLADAIAGIIKHTSDDPSFNLLSQLNYEDEQTWETLAKGFILCGDFAQAAKIFERKSLFKRAAIAFDKAGDLDRSIYCFEREGMYDKVKELKKKKKALADASKSNQIPSFSPGSFSISNLPIPNDSFEESPTTTERNSFEAEEDTAIVDGDDPILSEAMTAPEIASPSVSKPSILENEAIEIPPLEISENDDTILSEAMTAPEIASPSVSKPSIPENEAIEIPPLEISENDSTNTLELEKTDSKLSPILNIEETQDNPAIAETTEEEATENNKEILAEEDISFENEGKLLDVSHPDLPPPEQSDEEQIAIFNQSHFLSPLTDQEKKKIWDIGETSSYAQNYTILNYSDEPEGVYIILQGEIDCFKNQAGSDAYVDTMSIGETFGEFWLLTDHPTAVKFKTKSEDVKVHLICRKRFDALLDSEGSIARKIYKRFTSKLLTRLLSPAVSPGQNQKAG